MNKSYTKKSCTVPSTSMDYTIIKALQDNPYGLTIKTLEKLIMSPRQTIYWHLRKLKKAKIIENIFPIWKLLNSSDLPLKVKHLPKGSEQGHKMIWILPLIKKPDWWNHRKDRFMKLKDWQYKKEVTANNNVYHQINKDDMQIQAFKNSIYFICKAEYLESNPAEVFNKAKDDVLDAIKFLEEKFKFKFIAEGNFHLTISDSHYVTLKDALSEKLYKDKERFRITTEEGYHLWLDFSEPIGTESDNPEVKRRYLRHYKNIIDSPDLPLPSELAEGQKSNEESIKDLIIIQKKEMEKWAYYAETIQVHIKSIDELGSGVKEMGQGVKQLTNKISELDISPRKQETTTTDTSHHISKNLRKLMNIIKDLKDIFKYKDRIIKLDKNEKSILDDYLFSLE